MHRENIKSLKLRVAQKHRYMLPPPTMLCHLLGAHTGIYPHEQNVI